MSALHLQELFIVIEGAYASITLQSLAFDFARSASKQEESSTLQVTWRDPPFWVTDVHNTLPLGVRECRVAGKPYRLHLITFPEAIPRDFSLTALQFPFHIAGLVLTIDLSEDIFREGRASNSSARLKSSEAGGIRWAKETNLPCVVVATSLEPPLVPLDEIGHRLGLPPHIPVLPYTGEIHGGATFHLFLTYEYQYTQEALATLIEQIESSGS